MHHLHKVKASEAIRLPQVPKVRKGIVPIRASELVKRRHEKAVKDLQKAIEQREDAFLKLGRINAKIWQLARQVQRYEKLV